MTDADRQDLANAPAIPGLVFEAVAGRGGMSIVYKAWCQAENRHVAVKVMDPAFNDSAKDVRQFIIEAKAMNTVSHPNIVHANPADFIDGKYYFTMDFVGGYTLGELLARKKFLHEQDVLTVAEAVGEGLRYAWNTQSMVHCDLKPENIMVDSDGSIKITDLGIAHIPGVAETAPSPDDVLGTPAYISPEQVLGTVELDQRSDIYSLGATLYHLASGQTPFPGLSNDDTMRAHVQAASQAPDPRTIQPILSEGLVRIIAKAMAKNRKNRYQSWSRFLDDVHIVFDNNMPTLPPGLVSSVSLAT